MIGFQLVGPFVGFFLAAPFYPKPMTEMVNDMQAVTQHEGLKTSLFIMQGVAAIIGLIVIPWLVTKSQKMDHRALFTGRITILPIAIIFVLTFCIMIAESPIAVWNQEIDLPSWAKDLETKAKEMTEYLTGFDSVNQFILAFIVIGVLAAVGEEFFFRGIIQRELFRGTGNIHVAIWITAIIFSAFHFQFFGFLPRMILGALFGYLYYWSGNLIIPMIAHFFNNGLIVIALYLHQKGMIEADPGDEKAAPLSLVLPAVAFTIALLIFFRKFYQRPADQQNFPHSLD